ncbi:MAG: hypothetical protein AAF639_13475 [Chloroflexota bacterium]
MYNVAVSKPAGIEQIAAVINSMNPVEQNELLALVPGFYNRVLQIDRRIQSYEQIKHETQQEEPISAGQITADKTHERVRDWVLNAFDNKPPSLDAVFFDGWTLGEYLSLSDEQEAELWAKWEDVDLFDMGEVEVSPNVVLV